MIVALDVTPAPDQPDVMDGKLWSSVAAAVARVLPVNGFADESILGDGSILESRDWYSDAATVAADEQNVGAHHIEVGHDPHALGADGAIAVAQTGALFRIDCGMSPDVDDSQGALLRIQHSPSEDVAQSLAADGTVTELWRGTP